MKELILINTKYQEQDTASITLQRKYSSKKSKAERDAFEWLLHILQNRK